MARLRSPEKHRAILDAAIAEIAENGLTSSTASIAQRAGIAAGTLFLYFPTKEALFNALYLDMKCGVYERVNTSFPYKGSLKARAFHIWRSYLGWALEFPHKHKVSRQLNLSDIITAETRAAAAEGRENIDATLADVAKRIAMQDLPEAFAAAVMSAMHDATVEFLKHTPRNRAALMERAFEVYWRTVR